MNKKYEVRNDLNNIENYLYNLTKLLPDSI